MNTSSATRTSDTKRPLFRRVARKWYTWAGMALMMTASYLAIDGQLKLDGMNLLQAAPPPNEVPWTAIPATAATPAAPIEPMAAEEPAEEPLKLPEDLLVPEVAVLPPEKAKPLSGSKVESVLNAYVQGQGIVPASNQEVPPIEVPMIPVPVAPVQPIPVPVAPVQPLPVPELPVQPMPILATADPVKMNEPAPAPKTPAPPQTEPAPVIAEPLAARPDAPLVIPPRSLDNPPAAVSPRPTEQPQPLLITPNQQAAAPEGEPIPTKPTPQEASANTALAAEVESLKPNERLLYEAAQNSAKLKDYVRTTEQFDQLFKARPDLVFIRGEYAGLMVTAGELARAVEQYKRAIELRPDLMQFRIRLGDVYVIGKDYKSAIRIYAEALKTPPFEPEYAVRLARAYAFDNDFNRAFQVYDAMLANIKPDDPRAPIALGALLLDLDMPAEALPYLLEKRKQLEKGARRREITLLEVLSSIVRAHARLGQRQQAMEVIAELPVLAIDQIGIRETLADQLYAIEEFELSAQIWNQILQLDPTNGPAIIGMARVYLRMSQPAQARQILDSFRPAPRQVRDYLATYAVYHERVGEYIEAQQIYSDMLRRNPNDHEMRLALGLLLDRDFGKDEWERAKAEFAKIPPTERFGRDARRDFADVLANQRKYQEALEVDRLLLTEDPCDYLTIAQATKHYSKAGMYDPAIALARGFLSTNPRSEFQAVAVRLALARALLDARKFLDSIREYEILISRPSGRKVEAYYGLVRAHEKLGNTERSKQFLACTAGLPGGEFRNRLALAELYAADYDDNAAIAICMSLLNQDPRHLPTLIRLADCQQRQARFSGQPADAFQTAQTILGMSTSNVRAYYVMARSFAVAQNYRKSAGQYDQLIQLDPDLYGPRRERARILYADHQYSAARSSWDQIQRPSADDQMLTNIGDIITRNPKMQAFLQPYIVSGVAGPGLRKELGRLAVTVPDPELRLGVHRLCCDYDARLASVNAVRLEEDAMEVKDYRPLTALGVIPLSMQFEPKNADTWFALGQQLGALSRNAKEIGVYGDVLQIDPTHRDAQVATERSNAEMGPKLDANYSYFWQKGRTGLAAIQRQKETVDGRIPLGDENEYLMFGYTRADYHPIFNNYPDAQGNIPFMRVQKRFANDLLLTYAQLNVEEFKNGFSTRPTFDVGGIYQCCDWMWYKFGGYFENVAENGESIRQNIGRGGIYTGADFRPTRIWAFGGQYQYAHYTDNNDMNSFTLYNELQVTPAPKLLKLAERMYYWGYRDPTVFPTNPPDERNIFGAKHPYFAPAGYSQVELRVEWWHWLSRDYFVHSNQCYYSLQYGIMTDSNLVTFHNLRALLNYDVCTWLTIGAQADAQLSSVYNMFSAQGFLQIRFK